MKIKVLTGLLAMFAFLSITSYISLAPDKEQIETTTKSLHWSYEGSTGPENWANIDKEYSACANGMEQSPINIELTNTKQNKNAVPIKVNYQSTPFTLFNNGNTIQANDNSGSNSLVLAGDVYRLQQVHFHNPSEHQINGQSFEMEGHFVHENNIGKLAVLAVLIKIGKENTVLADMWSKLPKERTESAIPLHHAVDLANILPREKNAFQYNGSLTTPPCVEKVKWIILEKAIEMSEEQIGVFGSVYSPNNRPIQSLNNRTILEIQW